MPHHQDSLRYRAPATEIERRDAALRFVRKLSGFSVPSKAHEAAFEQAVQEVAASASRLIDSLHTSVEPRNREVEAAKARERSRMRSAADRNWNVPTHWATIFNLGPKSAEMLSAAGITSIEQLTALGSVRAFTQVKRVHPGASLNLLWALEGALTGEPWQLVAKEHRTSLLLALEEHLRRKD